MRIGERRIRIRVPRPVVALHDRLARARYFRGHGVHSPYIYDIVRQVFMRRELLPGDRKLLRALLAAGVSEWRAVQLQNLSIHCGYADFGLNRAEASLCVLTRDLPTSQILPLVRRAALEGHTVAVMSPYKDAERQALCRELVGHHGSTSVDNRAYLLIFNNHLPKQHFRI